ncbi:MAG: hypothetical protein AB7I41_12230 [Candidatus Sericytochromatia bacterium]
MAGPVSKCVLGVILCLLAACQMPLPTTKTESQPATLLSFKQALPWAPEKIAVVELSLSQSLWQVSSETEKAHFELRGNQLRSLSADEALSLLNGREKAESAKLPLSAVLSAMAKALPDGIPLQNGELLWVLEEPTSRYAHGVLGDRYEAGSLGIYDLSSAKKQKTLVLPENEVFETLRPLAGELTATSPGSEVILTVSVQETGAALRVYSAQGDELATGAKIGTAFRWQQPLAVEQFAAGLPPEIVTVQTPHIGGVLQFYQLQAGQLVKSAELSGFSTHFIGSRNLDMFYVLDIHGDARPEILLPSQDRRQLLWVQRQKSGVQILSRKALSGPLSSNLSALKQPSTPCWLAAGSADGVFHLWQENCHLADRSTAQ